MLSLHRSLQVRSEYGVSGVPFFVFRGQAHTDEGAAQLRPMGVSGAQDVETLLQVMNKALEPTAPSM